MFHLGEDEGFLHSRVLKEGNKESVFIFLVYVEQALIYPFHCRSFGRYGDLYRIGDNSLSKAPHVIREGSREKHSLSLFRNFDQYPLYIGHKAHIEHSVYLVEDEDFHLFQVDMSLSHEIKEPPRSGDENIYPAVQDFHLVKLVYSAENYRVIYFKIASVGIYTVSDLCCQFSCRYKDERSGSTPFRTTFTLMGKTLEQGE